MVVYLYKRIIIITQEKLKSILEYDSNTGIFIWLNANSNRVKNGSIAGTLMNKGYIHIKIQGKKYLAHRLAWLYVYGIWPLKFVDHKNNIRSDNRIDNLREATNSQNICNRTKQKNSTSGYKGIYWNKRDKIWIVQIKKNNIIHRCGYFKNLEDAIIVRNLKYLEIHKEFCNLS